MDLWLVALESRPSGLGLWVRGVSASCSAFPHPARRGNAYQSFSALVVRGEGLNFFTLQGIFER